ncbi:Bas1 protein [Saccharomycopsis crataegensis]|uniref:Bas1 protein n=1 Tax=Saccharomycopsis crataegensis TaxID=43959 RepID=A0AAV5QI85_9ASCO|nr:Bas1 protein [Saccharomycopsis crataegensis]
MSSRASSKTRRKSTRKKIEPIDPLQITEDLGIQTFRRESRKPWTPEEDSLLVSLVQRHLDERLSSPLITSLPVSNHGSTNLTSPITISQTNPNAIFESENPEKQLIPIDKIPWDIISTQLPDRKLKDCRKRWSNSLDPNLRKGRWTKAEDELLIAAHKEHGPSWQKVALSIPGRTDDQCAKRYIEVLDPSMTQDRLRVWSVEEDLALTALVKKFGTRWRTVSLGMKSRPSLTCRNRWRKVITDVTRGKADKRVIKAVKDIEGAVGSKNTTAALAISSAGLSNKAKTTSRSSSTSSTAPSTPKTKNPKKTHACSSSNSGSITLTNPSRPTSSSSTNSSGSRSRSRSCTVTRSNQKQASDASTPRSSTTPRNSLTIDMSHIKQLQQNSVPQSISVANSAVSTPVTQLSRNFERTLISTSGNNPHSHHLHSNFQANTPYPMAMYQQETNRNGERDSFEDVNTTPRVNVTGSGNGHLDGDPLQSPVVLTEERSDVNVNGAFGNDCLGTGMSNMSAENHCVDRNCFNNSVAGENMNQNDAFLTMQNMNIRPVNSGQNNSSTNDQEGQGVGFRVYMEDKTGRRLSDPSFQGINPPNTGSFMSPYNGALTSLPESPGGMNRFLAKCREAGVKFSVIQYQNYNYHNTDQQQQFQPGQFQNTSSAAISGKIQQQQQPQSQPQHQPQSPNEFTQLRVQQLTHKYGSPTSMSHSRHNSSSHSRPTSADMSNMNFSHVGKWTDPSVSSDAINLARRHSSSAQGNLGGSAQGISKRSSIVAAPNNVPANSNISRRKSVSSVSSTTSSKFSGRSPRSRSSRSNVNSVSTTPYAEVGGIHNSNLISGNSTLNNAVISAPGHGHGSVPIAPGYGVAAGLCAPNGALSSGPRSSLATNNINLNMGGGINMGIDMPYAPEELEEGIDFWDDIRYSRPPTSNSAMNPNINQNTSSSTGGGISQMAPLIPSPNRTQALRYSPQQTIIAATSGNHIENSRDVQGSTVVGESLEILGAPVSQHHPLHYEQPSGDSMGFEDYGGFFYGANDGYNGDDNTGNDENNVYRAYVAANGAYGAEGINGGYENDFDEDQLPFGLPFNPS